jgi:regulator of sigma E protease
MDVVLTIILDVGHIVLYYLFPFIAVIGIMIFFHELGHFLIAKSFRVKVLKFCLGFGPKLVGKKVGETEYLISYFPLGGFVKMLGEDVGDEEQQDLSPDDVRRSFNNQHVLKRVAIVAAGPIFNLVLALVLFCGLFLISGTQEMTTEIGQVREGSPAHRAGLMKGDVILSVQGQTTESWTEIKSLVQDQAGNPLAFSIQRGDQILDLTITPQEALVKNEFGEDIKSALIGIVASGKVKKVEMSPWEAIQESYKETWKWIRLTCLVVVKLFQGIVPMKTIGGPILIGQMTGKLAQESFGYLIPFMAIISINLGILNFFPIPILDGGVIIFLLIELIIGRPIGIKKRELAQKVGLSLLILVMAFVFYNDILRLFE